MVILIQVWDLRQMALYWETNVGNGVCGVEWDRRDIEVIVLSFKLINIYASSSYMRDIEIIVFVLISLIYITIIISITLR